MYYKPIYNPSPGKIKAECAKIRAGWNKRTMHSRNQYKADPIDIRDNIVKTFDIEEDTPFDNWWDKL